VKRRSLEIDAEIVGGVGSGGAIGGGGLRGGMRLAQDLLQSMEDVVSSELNEIRRCTTELSHRYKLKPGGGGKSSKYSLDGKKTLGETQFYVSSSSGQNEKCEESREDRCHSVPPGLGDETISRAQSCPRIANEKISLKAQTPTRNFEIFEESIDVAGDSSPSMFKLSDSKQLPRYFEDSFARGATGQRFERDRLSRSQRSYHSTSMFSSVKRRQQKHRFGRDTSVGLFGSSSSKERVVGAEENIASMKEDVREMMSGMLAELDMMGAPLLRTNRPVSATERLLNRYSCGTLDSSPLPSPPSPVGGCDSCPDLRWARLSDGSPDSSGRSSVARVMVS